MALADTSVIKLTSQADGDLSDGVSGDTTIASSNTDAVPGNVSLFDGDSPLSSTGTDAGDVANLAAVTALDDSSGILVDNDLGDDATNVDASASNGTVVAQGDVISIDGDSSLGSSETFAAGDGGFTPVALANGAYNFAAPATGWVGNAIAASVAVVVARRRRGAVAALGY